jgi:hypothetical protein
MLDLAQHIWETGVAMNRVAAASYDSMREPPECRETETPEEREERQREEDADTDAAIKEAKIRSDQEE